MGAISCGYLKCLKRLLICMIALVSSLHTLVFFHEYIPKIYIHLFPIFSSVHAFGSASELNGPRMNA